MSILKTSPHLCGYARLFVCDTERCGLQTVGVLSCVTFCPALPTALARLVLHRGRDIRALLHQGAQKPQNSGEAFKINMALYIVYIYCLAIGHAHGFRIQLNL